MRVGKAFAVDIAKCVEERSEHFASFLFAEWAVGETSSKVFLSVFHERENQIHVRKFAAAAR